VALAIIVSATACAPTAPPAETVGPRDFSAIDAHALAAPEHVTGSPAALARYLTAPARDDVERVRALYRWVTANIAYDAESYLSGNVRRVESWDEVLRTRVAVCDGYSGLLQELGRHGGVRIERVEGYARGLRSGGTKPSGAPNHAWNAVHLDGRWHLLDPTWGAGHLEQGEFVPSFSEFWFLTPPEAMIFSHLPQDRRWQLLNRPLPARAFHAQPDIPRAFFELGIGPDRLRAEMQERSFAGFPAAFNRPGHDIRVLDAPMTRRLRAGEPYRFAIHAPGAKSVAVVTGGRWVDLPPAGGDAFSAEVHPEVGELAVHAAFPGAGQGYHALLVYEVE
jgi:hypothetical protein